MPPFRLITPAGDQSFELPPGKSVVVGRGLGSDIALYDPTISRRHAELRPELSARVVLAIKASL